MPFCYHFSYYTTSTELLFIHYGWKRATPCLFSLFLVLSIFARAMDSKLQLSPGFHRKFKVSIRVSSLITQPTVSSAVPISRLLSQLHILDSLPLWRHHLLSWFRPQSTSRFHLAKPEKARRNRIQDTSWGSLWVCLRSTLLWRDCWVGWLCDCSEPLVGVCLCHLHRLKFDSKRRVTSSMVPRNVQGLPEESEGCSTLLVVASRLKHFSISQSCIGTVLRTYGRFCKFYSSIDWLCIVVVQECTTVQISELLDARRTLDGYRFTNPTVHRIV